MPAAQAILNTKLTALHKETVNEIKTASDNLRTIREEWRRERQEPVEAAHQEILRELQKDKIDGAEFIKLRRQIEQLVPLKEKQQSLLKQKKECQDERRTLLAQWGDVKTEEYQRLQNAAKAVNKELNGRILVRVTFTGNRDQFFQFLKDEIGGRLSDVTDTLKQRGIFSVIEFVNACRAGKEELQKWRLSASQAERFAQTPPDVLMKMEELDLGHTTDIQLNVAAEGQPTVWQSLGELSTGQKATAVLLLLLLESDAPLVVDQPEDDLDNRFITDGVVPKMREEKRRRQFLFATHNANIPVLGDAELIMGLRPYGEAGQGKAKILPDTSGQSMPDQSANS
jgi:chromosome segregation ATPase